MAQLYTQSFVFILENLIDNLKDKLTKLNITQNKNDIDKKKIADLCHSIQRLFDELKKVPEIEENPKFIDLNNEINKSIA